MAKEELDRLYRLLGVCGRALTTAVFGKACEAHQKLSQQIHPLDLPCYWCMKQQLEDLQKAKP